MCCFVAMEMNDIVELYAKLLIGIFSFIGPSFTLLIPISYPAMLRSREKHLNTLSRLAEIFITEKTEANLNEMKIQFKNIQKSIKAHEKEIRLINPKRQLRKIFFSLLLSLFLVVVYYFQRTAYWPFRLHTISVTSLLISVCFFYYGLISLWRMFCKIVEIKREELDSSLSKLNLKNGTF